jgi:diguanylate cyclase (GGDEF)-like protein/PAS domain S-box-containing protein
MREDRLSPEAYRALYVHSPYGVLFTNPNGDVLAANPAACELLRFSETDICALGRQGLADHSDQRWEQLLAERARSGRGSGIARMLRGDGTVVEVEMSARVFSDADGTPRTCTIIRDVTERVRLEAELLRLNERLGELAVTDELTGLHNRRGLLAAGGQLLDLAARQGVDVSVLFLDVDKFKRLNDGLGHPAGDAALRVVGDALRHTLRRPDAIARIGGDEFVAVALDLGEAECVAIAQRIQEQLSLPAAVVAVGQPVEVSIGWATLQPGESGNIEDLIGRADRAMYQTKLAKDPRSLSAPSVLQSSA